MAVIRIEALRRLAALIQTSVPALKGRVCGGRAEAPKRLAFPHLSIFAVRFNYFPDQAELAKTLGNSRAVYNVGRVEGTVQFRLGATSANQRYELEQAIMENVFWSDIERPGIVVFQVPDCHDAVVAFELDSDEWSDERAFDKKWYSVMTAALQLPALVTKGSVYDMEEIRLTLTEDLSTPIVTVPPSEKETVSIAEDGSVTVAIGP